MYIQRLKGKIYVSYTKNSYTEKFQNSEKNIFSPKNDHFQRSRLVEDGFNNLSAFTARELRQTIRVKFYNDLGLAEAGIDQDGVFKEFLEEINKRILDPQEKVFHWLKFSKKNNKKKNSKKFSKTFSEKLSKVQLVSNDRGQ